MTYNRVCRLIVSLIKCLVSKVCEVQSVLPRFATVFRFGDTKPDTASFSSRRGIGGIRLGDREVRLGCVSFASIRCNSA